MATSELNFDAISELKSMFNQMNQDVKAGMSRCGKEIANNLKSNTEQAIPRAPKAKHGTHLADDVQASVKTTDTSVKITVKGGKKTGSLWWIVDNGHVAPNGKFVPGAHFTDRAYQATDVNSIVDGYISEVLKDE